MTDHTVVDFGMKMTMTQMISMASDGETILVGNFAELHLWLEKDNIGEGSQDPSRQEEMPERAYQRTSH